MFLRPGAVAPGSCCVAPAGLGGRVPQSLAKLHLHLVFSTNAARRGCTMRCELSRTMPICDAVEAVKSASSRWLKTQGDEFGSFAWQAGDGVFAVSSSNIRRVCAYIASQREHHRRTDFRDEYRGLLERHQAPTRGCTRALVVSPLWGWRTIWPCSPGLN